MGTVEPDDRDDARPDARVVRSPRRNRLPPQPPPESRPRSVDVSPCAYAAAPPRGQPGQPHSGEAHQRPRPRDSRRFRPPTPTTRSGPPGRCADPGLPLGPLIVGRPVSVRTLSARADRARADPARTVTPGPAHAVSPAAPVRSRRRRRADRRCRTGRGRTRQATIASAVTGPTPGSASRSSTVAVLRSTRTRRGAGGRRRRRAAFRSGRNLAGDRTAHGRRLARGRRLDTDHDLLTVTDPAGHVQPDQIGTVQRPAGGFQRIGDSRPGLQGHQARLVHQSDHADHHLARRACCPPASGHGRRNHLYRWKIRRGDRWRLLHGSGRRR